jgi:hypothetical protein
MELSLTQGKVAYIDEDMIEKAEKFNWSAALQGRKPNLEWQAFRSSYEKKQEKDNRYPSSDYRRSFDLTRIYLVRYLFDIPEDKVAIFLNGNKLDCRKSNVRIEKRNWQHSLESGLYKTSPKRSGGIGDLTKVRNPKNNPTNKYNYVKFDNRAKKWLAKFGVIYLGSFEREEDAAHVVDTFMIKDKNPKMYKINFDSRIYTPEALEFYTRLSEDLQFRKSIEGYRKTKQKFSSYDQFIELSNL